MNQFNDQPLTAEGGDKVAAHIEPWVGPQLGGDGPIPASYGASLTVNGKIVRLIWGSGYATHPIPIVALAVARILDFTPVAIPLAVYALKDFGRYWGSNGHVVKIARRGGHTGAGKPFPAWSTMQRLQSEYLAGRWFFRPRLLNPRSQIRETANDAMRLSAQAAALAHQRTFSPAPGEDLGGVILLGGTHDLP